MTFAGITTLNETSSGAASTLFVLGTAGNDNFTYTPNTTDNTAGTVTGVGPTINFAGVGSTFTLDAVGGADTVTVDGSSAADTIAIVRAVFVTTVQTTLPNPLKTVTLPNADTQSLIVASLTGSDQIDVSGAGGPATLTVLGGQTPAGATLNVTNTTAGTTTVTPGNTNDSGTVVNGDGTINFGGIKSVKITAATVTDTLTVNGTNGNDTITTATVGPPLLS